MFWGCLSFTLSFPKPQIFTGLFCPWCKSDCFFPIEKPQIPNTKTWKAEIGILLHGKHGIILWKQPLQKKHLWIRHKWSNSDFVTMFLSLVFRTLGKLSKKPMLGVFLSISKEMENIYSGFLNNQDSALLANAAYPLNPLGNFAQDLLKIHILDGTWTWPFSTLTRPVQRY